MNIRKHFQISPLPKLGSCGNSGLMSWRAHLLGGRDAVTMRPAGVGVGWGRHPGLGHVTAPHQIGAPWAPPRLQDSSQSTRC